MVSIIIIADQEETSGVKGGTCLGDKHQSQIFAANYLFIAMPAWHTMLSEILWFSDTEMKQKVSLLCFPKAAFSLL